eukprot:7382947-Prymnesium_polylepis.1
MSGASLLEPVVPSSSLAKRTSNACTCLSGTVHACIRYDNGISLSDEPELVIHVQKACRPGLCSPKELAAALLVQHSPQYLLPIRRGLLLPIRRGRSHAVDVEA